MQLVFATANAHKVQEINEILRGATPFDVVTKTAIGCNEELPETTGTIRGNAIQKAQYLFDKYGVDCFSEDTGLEIDALNGEPGVDTAFYSGSRDAVKNMTFVLEKMGETTQRTARFRTVIALILRGSLHIFEGVCEGTIRPDISHGTEGFGYDPLFQPEGYDLTFAELGFDVKNQISHRARATHELLAFLKKSV